PTVLYITPHSRRRLFTLSHGATGGAGTSSSVMCTFPRRGAADSVTTREGCSALEPAGLDEGDAGGRVLGAQQAHELGDRELAHLGAARVDLRDGGQQAADVGEILASPGEQDG